MSDVGASRWSGRPRRNGQQGQPQVLELPQDAKQRGLVDDVTAQEGRAVGFSADGQTVEPRAPTGVEVTSQSDLIAAAGVATVCLFAHSWTVRRNLVSTHHHMW